MKLIPGLVSATFKDRSVEEVIALAVKAGLKAIEWSEGHHVPVDKHFPQFIIANSHFFTSDSSYARTIDAAKSFGVRHEVNPYISIGHARKSTSDRPIGYPRCPLYATS